MEIFLVILFISTGLVNVRSTGVNLWALRRWSTAWAKRRRRRGDFWSYRPQGVKEIIWIYLPSTSSGMFEGFTRWWQLKYLLCSPRKLGKIAILTHSFWDGLVHPKPKDRMSSWWWLLLGGVNPRDHEWFLFTPRIFLAILSVQTSLLWKTWYLDVPGS